MGNRALFITRHNPSTNGGGNFASRAFLEAVSATFKSKVTLFVSSDFDESVLINKPDEIIKVKKRHSLDAIAGLLRGKLTRFEKSVESWLKSNDVSNFEWVFLDGGIIGGSYVKKFKDKDIKTCTIHHNFEVEYHIDNKSLETFKGRVKYWIKKLEQSAYKNSNVNLFLTEDDLRKFENYYGKHAMNFELGCFEFPVPTQSLVNSDYYPNKLLDTKQNYIKAVISGSLNTVQTLSSFKWFLEHIYPLILNAYPNFSLTLTGRSPTEEIIALCDNFNVTLISSPIDIRAVISEHHLYICPIKLGGGLKLRVMDAIAIGMPCLIQSNSFRGYEVFDTTGIVLKYNDEKDFMSAFNILINRIIKDRSDSSADLRQQYELKFSFLAGRKRLENILR
ncbi:hypothetical protein GCM10009120_28140 [Sphingobacterium siyangense subsp. cladoniae]|uniref:glycosyltransferase family 4 protein n=1 Tax=Sphingobacterium siyangense TaxID=459529 RepID=UPI0031F96E8F